MIFYPYWTSEYAPGSLLVGHPDCPYNCYPDRPGEIYIERYSLENEDLSFLTIVVGVHSRWQQGWSRVNAYTEIMLINVSWKRRGVDQKRPVTGWDHTRNGRRIQGTAIGLLSLLSIMEMDEISTAEYGMFLEMSP